MWKDLLNLVHSRFTVLEGSQFNFSHSLQSTKSYYAIFIQKKYFKNHFERFLEMVNMVKNGQNGQNGQNGENMVKMVKVEGLGVQC